MIDPFAMPEGFENPLFLIHPRRRQPRRHRIADSFSRRVTIKPLSALVPTVDGPCQIGADDRVVGRLYDSRQVSRGLFPSLDHADVHSAAIETWPAVNQ